MLIRIPVSFYFKHYENSYATIEKITFAAEVKARGHTNFVEYFWPISTHK